MENCAAVIWIKNWLYIPAFLIAIGFPEQIAWSITVLTILMLIDFITGIIASIKIDGPKSITSKRMTASAISKMFIILVALIIALIGKGLRLDFMTYLQGSLSVLILAEAYSNFGNIQSFKTGKRAPEIDAVSIVLKRVRKMILGLLEKAK